MGKPFAIALLIVLSAILGGNALAALQGPSRIDISGKEEPRAGGIYNNGFNVEHPFKDMYLRYEALLGEPVTGSDGQRQRFRFGELVYHPGNSPEWTVEFASLGRVDMMIEGYTPSEGHSPHPGVRDWLRSQLEVGLDLTRTVGPFISDPICKGNLCVQWSEKMRFEFPRNATSGDQVHRAPIGLWITHPGVRLEHGAGSEGASVGPWPFVAGSLGALALWALLRARRTENDGPVTL